MTEAKGSDQVEMVDLIERARRQVLLDQTGSFRPVLDPPVGFECVACCTLTEFRRGQWNWGSHGMWQCPDCGNDLSPDEARVLLEAYRNRFRDLLEAVDVRRGKGWLWRKIFSR